MSKPLGNQACLDLSGRLDIASQKIVRNKAKIMNNVIQLDVRRAKLDKIAARKLAHGVELCLRSANCFTTHGARAGMLRRSSKSLDELQFFGRDGEIRLALRALGEDV